MGDYSICSLYVASGQHGAGQAQLTLSPGRKYVIGVRAVTSSGRFIEAESNGFSVDASPPAINIVSVGAHVTNGSAEAPLYQADNASYTATWVVSDPESGISDVWYYVGTYPGKTVFIFLVYLRIVLLRILELSRLLR